MSNFLPHNEENARVLEEKLSESMFRSVKDFVQFYNSGLINKSFDLVKETAKEITETFKNVKEKSGQLVLISQEEVFLEEILENLKPWEGIVKAKREIESSVKDGKINENTILVLDANKFVFEAINNEGERFSLNGEKLFNKSDNIDTLLNKSSYGDDFNEEYNGYVFAAKDLLDIDTNFVQAIKSNLPQ